MKLIHSGRRVVLALVAGAVVTAAVAASATAGSAKAAACSGTPAKIMVMTTLTATVGQNNPSIPTGAQAAAAALTKSCQLGVPVQIIVCDDKFSPNDAAGCARQAVEEKAIAFLLYGGFGDSVMPILSAAGIPVLGNAASSAENSDPLSFPVQFPIAAVIGVVSLCASLGATNIAIPIIDIPSVGFFVDLGTKAAAGYGVKTNVIRVPPTATDMAPFAAQIIASKADCVLPIDSQTHILGLLKSLKQSGVDFKKVPFVQDLGGLSSAFVAQAGAANMDGIAAGGTAWSPTDRANPAIKRYISELKAAKKNTNAGSLSTLGVMYWAGVHVVADALKGLKPTPANIVKGLNTKGKVVTTTYGLPPIDYTTPAFPKNTILNKLRIFTKYSSAWRFDAKGVPHPLVNRWVDVTRKIKGLS